MDKKKVKEHIQRALIWIDPMTTESANYETAIKMAAKNLEFAMEELFKSDWVSVEDRLPPIGEAVRARSKQHPNDFMLACRIDENTMKTIYPHKYYSCDVTHWKPIEKLEE